MEQINCIINTFYLTKCIIAINIKSAVQHYNRSTLIVKAYFIDSSRDTSLWLYDHIWLTSFHKTSANPK